MDPITISRYNNGDVFVYKNYIDDLSIKDAKIDIPDVTYFDSLYNLPIRARGLGDKDRQRETLFLSLFEKSDHFGDKNSKNCHRFDHPNFLSKKLKNFSRPRFFGNKVKK